LITLKWQIFEKFEGVFMKPYSKINLATSCHWKTGAKMEAEVKRAISARAHLVSQTNQNL